MWIERHGKTWRIRERVAGRLVTLADGYPTKTAARGVLVQLQADKVRGESLQPRGGKLTLGAWLDAWWPPYAAARKPSARIAAEGILRRYIRPALGGYALEELSPLVVQQWTAAMLAGVYSRAGKPLSPKTIRNAHGLLHRALGDAVAQRMIRTNPCERTGLPRRVHHEMRFLTPQEAEQFMAVVPGHWRPLVMLLLATGLRFGEAIGLRVRDVDVLGCTLTVRVTTQELATAGLDLVDVAPKPGRSRRTVGFPRDIGAMLIPLVANKSRDERVLTAPRGGPVRIRALHREWRKWRVRADLDGLRVHDLRHTHAGWLISAGTPLTAVQHRLGHSSITVTSDMYGHLLPEVHEAIASTLDAHLPAIFGEQGGSNHPGASLSMTEQDGETLRSPGRPKP